MTKECSTCCTVHKRCVCGRCHGGPPPAEPYCESCDRHHPAGDEHCPNCGQPASSGFHAGMNLADCPVWGGARGWIPTTELTPDERRSVWGDENYDGSTTRVTLPL